ncbi:hypothetical protein [Acaryochloris thomasi]|nr:hypothetical protein [Acaryochloris thomasi]
MFFDELSPLFQEFLQKPLAFMGGFTSGVFRLNLADDPVKSWLEKETGKPVSDTAASNFDSSKNGGPQSISID